MFRKACDTIIIMNHGDGSSDPFLEITSIEKETKRIMVNSSLCRKVGSGPTTKYLVSTKGQPIIIRLKTKTIENENVTIL